MKHFLGTVLSIALTTSVLSAQNANGEQSIIKGEVSGRFNNAPVLLISLSQGDTIAQTTVENKTFTFVEDYTTPQLLQIRVGGRALGNVITEPGVITFTADAVTGTPLNNMLTEYSEYYADVYSQLSDLSRQEPIREDLMQNLIDRLNSYSDSVMMANIDNPVGASILLNSSYEMELPQLLALVNEHPVLGDYSKIKQIIHHKTVAAETGVGKKYKDFTIDYDGTSTKLSELIKPGRYTLVDFWASWCGPCRREIPVIKDLLNQYGPNGLDVIGVAVWDEPDDTKKAIEELGITWPVIINARTVPTDLYGILGIPSIILISPDGTILSRDKQDEDLQADVAKYLAK